MTCAETESHLVDAADGRLDVPTEVRLHAHLDGCAACRERAASLRRSTQRGHEGREHVHPIRVRLERRGVLHVGRSTNVHANADRHPVETVRPPSSLHEDPG